VTKAFVDADASGDEIVILNAVPYDFTTEKGEHIAGVKVRWCFGGDPVHSDRLIGLEMFDDNLPLDAVNDLVSVPGAYSSREVSRSIKQKNGSMSRVMKLVGIKFLRPWALVAEPGPPAR
jgi:hypothetical protein